MVDYSVENYQLLYIWKDSLLYFYVYMCVCVYSCNSGIKSTHQAAVVSKIDSRLEQYTSAIEVRWP